MKNQIDQYNKLIEGKNKINQSYNSLSNNKTSKDKSQSKRKTKAKEADGSSFKQYHSQSQVQCQSINNKKRPRTTFGADEYEDYKIYEKNILNKIAKEEIYDDIGETKDVLGEFVDKVINRSLYLYKNRHCHFCAQLLSKGQSTHKCPKFHHKIQ